MITASIDYLEDIIRVLEILNELEEELKDAIEDINNKSKEEFLEVIKRLNNALMNNVMQLIGELKEDIDKEFDKFEEDIDKEFDKFEEECYKEKTFEIEKSILGIKKILNLNRKDITEDSNGLPRHITYHQEDIIRVLEILNELEEELKDAKEDINNKSKEEFNFMQLIGELKEDIDIKNLINLKKKRKH